MDLKFIFLAVLDFGYYNLCNFSYFDYFWILWGLAHRMPLKLPFQNFLLKFWFPLSFQIYSAPPECFEPKSSLFLFNRFLIWKSSITDYLYSHIFVALIIFSSMDSKPINIRWIRNISQQYWKIMQSIIIQITFHGY